jgi:hypothetical protein
MINLFSSKREAFPKREALTLIYIIPFALGLLGFFEEISPDENLGFLSNTTVVYCFLGIGLVGSVIDLVLVYKKIQSNQKTAAEEDNHRSENELKDRHRNR